MLNRSEKMQYLQSSLFKFVTRRGYDCPSCGAKESMVVDRKFFITTLNRCSSCNLLFRAPTTSSEEFNRFYQDDYSEGFTTEMPSEGELEAYKANKFVGSGKDYSDFIAVLRALGVKPGDSLLDYGCSWGYGAWQFSQIGLDVVGIELSKPRCNYARERLNINAHHDLNQVTGQFDVVFTSHVLEHIPEVRSCIDYAFSRLKPGGYFIAVTPNGSESYRQQQGKSWSKAWGFVHPLFIDDRFYQYIFRNYSYVIDSTPYDLERITQWASKPRIAGGHQQVVQTAGTELMVVVRAP